MADVQRCEICDWPLAERPEDGCVPGNCSYRPTEGSSEWHRIQQRRQELANASTAYGAMLRSKPMQQFQDMLLRLAQEDARFTEGFARAFIDEMALQPSECEMIVKQDGLTRTISFQKRETPGRWTCFHCGFKTNNPEEAAAHFGDRDEDSPLCQTWRELDADGRAREYQSTLGELNGERDENARLRSTIEGLEFRLGEFENLLDSRFKGCKTINDAFNLYDSMEGRALAAEKRLNRKGDEAQSFMCRALSAENRAELTEHELRNARHRLNQSIDRYRWRPIAEIHEDFGPCVLIDIRDPGRLAVGNCTDLDFDDAGWTHFTKITPLTIEEGQKLAAELPVSEEVDG